MKAPLKEAVALEYGARKTPVVSARGQDEVAQKSIEEAQKHGIYVAEDPPLLALPAGDVHRCGGHPVLGLLGQGHAPGG